MIIKRKLFGFPSHIDGKDKHGRFIIHTKDGKEVSPKIYYENGGGRIVLRDRETDEVIEKSYSKKEKNSKSKLNRLKLAAIGAIQDGARISRENMEHASIAHQMALDAHNQAVQDHMHMMNVNMHTFSNISEDKFYEELEDGIKQEKTTLRDRVQGAKIATKAAYQNVKGHLSAPKKVKTLETPAKIGYDSNGNPFRITEPKYKESDYKLKDRVKNISESITSIPEYYKGYVSDLKGARVDKKLHKKYNIKD